MWSRFEKFPSLICRECPVGVNSAVAFPFLHKISADNKRINRRMTFQQKNIYICWSVSLFTRHRSRFQLELQHEQLHCHHPHCCPVSHSQSAQGNSSPFSCPQRAALSIHPSIYPTRDDLSIYLSIHLFIYPTRVDLSIYLSVIMSRDF